MKYTVLLFLLFCASVAHSQHYYRDIIGGREAASLVASYAKAGVSSVIVNSYDENNTRIQDLNIRQQYLPDKRTLITTTGTPAGGASVLTSVFDGAGNIRWSIDSSARSLGKTEYRYDANGNLQSLLVSSTDSLKSFTETEEHLWQYDAQGRINRMLKVKNQRDTTVVNFKADDQGNIIEEQEIRKGRAQDPVYYYYNDKNQLTDIVRFNNKAGRLLPEYLFEYDTRGNLIQKITVPANSSEYIIWRYLWDERGLKTREAVYDKQKQLNGKIEYQYGFTPMR